MFYISGLGADDRAFERLHLSSITTSMYVAWIQHKEGESLGSYCQRLIAQYDISSEDLLVGLSFGGLIAQKIAELIGIKEIILLSSFRDKHDLRPVFKLGLRMKCYKIMPPIKVPVISNLVAYYLNSWNSESKSVLNAMLHSTDMTFMKWCIEKIDETKPMHLPNVAVYSFIGDKDKIVKTWRSKHLQIIRDGSHFMVHDRAKELAIELEKLINQ